MFYLASCASTPEKPGGGEQSKDGLPAEQVSPATEETPADLEPPKLIRRVNPEYPESMRKEGIQGKVMVKATIDREGNVQNPEVVQSLHEILDAEAINCVSKWKFEPGTKDGEPVDVEMTMSVEFKLM